MPSDLLVNCQSISKAYGTQTLFSNISLGFFANERLGLIGPNGSGKTTFLKILAGLEEPMSGKIALKRHTNLVYLPQEDRLETHQTAEETLVQSLPEASENWEQNKAIRTFIQQVAFPNLTQKVGTLSGGWRKRLAISSACIQKPDLLLMDEPTNHLDLAGILWLERLLKKVTFAFLLVSHDRTFLENTSNRIIELNKRYPCGFLKVEGNYSTFLKKREAFINAQAHQERALSNKVRQELAWLRRNPKARTTKAQYRVEQAYALQEDLSAVKSRNAANKTARIDFDATHRRTKRLIETRNLGMRRDGRVLFENLNLQLAPGHCLGVMGKNGAGKSTLIHLLNGSLAPDVGSIKYADGLQIVTFGQEREQLDRSQTLKQALCPDGDQVVYRGRPLHIAAWAKRFLFSAEQLRQPVSRLSGGEQARVLIANLILKPADVLLLDEPTNNLDIPTLEILEESLRNFPGAILLITHDRFLLDRLSDILLSFEGEGQAAFFSDYAQWLQVQEEKASSEDPSHKALPQRKTKSQTHPQKLSYDEKKELNRIGNKIEKTEEAVETIEKALHDQGIASDAERLVALSDQLQEAEEKVDQLYQRWEELDARRNL